MCMKHKREKNCRLVLEHPIHQHTHNKHTPSCNTLPSYDICSCTYTVLEQIGQAGPPPNLYIFFLRKKPQNQYDTNTVTIRPGVWKSSQSLVLKEPQNRAIPRKSWQVSLNFYFCFCCVKTPSSRRCCAQLLQHFTRTQRTRHMFRALCL